MFLKIILHMNHTSGALWPLRVYSRLVVAAPMDSSTSSGQNRKYTMVAQDNVSPWGSLTPLTQRSAQVINQLFNESVKRQQVTGNRICGPGRHKTSASPPDQPSVAGTSAASVVDVLAAAPASHLLQCFDASDSRRLRDAVIDGTFHGHQQQLLTADHHHPVAPFPRWTGPSTGPGRLHFTGKWKLPGWDACEEENFIYNTQTLAGSQQQSSPSADSIYQRPEWSLSSASHSADLLPEPRAITDKPIKHAALKFIFLTAGCPGWPFAYVPLWLWWFNDETRQVGALAVTVKVNVALLADALVSLLRGKHRYTPGCRTFTQAGSPLHFGLDNRWLRSAQFLHLTFNLSSKPIF